MYALGALSRALDAIKAAAFSMLDDTLGFVIGLFVSDGFSGSGGGALSGSELSHLYRVSTLLSSSTHSTYIGTEDRPRHSDCECECLTILDSLRSRDSSLV